MSRNWGIVGKRLNGWQRIGITISAIWLLCAPPYEYYRITSAAQFIGQLAFSDCLRRMPVSPCLQTFTFYHDAALKGAWWIVAAVASVPLFGWIAAYVALAVTFWIRRGFSESNTPIG